MEIGRTRQVFVDPPPPSGKRRELGWHVRKFYWAFFVGERHMYGFPIVYMTFISVGKRSSTLADRPIFLFAEQTTSRLLIWIHCHCLQILGFCFIISLRKILFGVILYALLKVRRDVVPQRELLYFVIGSLLSLRSPKTYFKWSWEACHTMKLTDLVMPKLPSMSS